MRSPPLNHSRLEPKWLPSLSLSLYRRGLHLPRLALPNFLKLGDARLEVRLVRGSAAPTRRSNGMFRPCLEKAISAWLNAGLDETQLSIRCSGHP